MVATDRGWKIFNRDVRLSQWASLIANDVVIIDGNGLVTPTWPVSATTLAASGATTLDTTLAVGGNVAVATNKFTVAAASGNTVIAGTLWVTGKVTADDVDLASGAVIAGLGTGANGIVLKNLKNAAASSLSGTQLDVQIDIGWTPYYFTCYPTKA